MVDSGKLPTYPSPNLTLTPASFFGQNVGVGGQFSRNDHYTQGFTIYTLFLSSTKGFGFKVLSADTECS